MLQDVYIYQEASFMASGVSFIYASSEKNRMLACRFGEHRDNSRNSQSVFLVVALYNGTPVYNFIDGFHVWQDVPDDRSVQVQDHT